MIDLYAITPERSRAEIAVGVARALQAEGSERIAILMRARHLPAREQRALGHTLRALTQQRGARLLVSADLALCKEIEADGVQLPESGPSVPEARNALGAHGWIGASRHDAQGLAAAALEGASFATLSPVYASPFKGQPLGVPAFAALAHGAALPVLALGGIEIQHVRALIAHGAAGIAVIRAVFDHADPATAVRSFLTEIDQAHSVETADPGARRL